jgi:hypothetical protein
MKPQEVPYCTLRIDQWNHYLDREVMHLRIHLCKVLRAGLLRLLVFTGDGDAEGSH